MAENKITFSDSSSRTVNEQELAKIEKQREAPTQKKWEIKDLEKVLKSKNRKNCSPPAPAQGLYLSKVI